MIKIVLITNSKLVIKDNREWEKIAMPLLTNLKVK